MISYDFEVICKNAIINKLEKEFNEPKMSIKELHLVWFSKTLQNFKCIIIDSRKNQRLYECTFNGDKKELYIDFYDKQKNYKFTSKDFNNEVKY